MIGLAVTLAIWIGCCLAARVIIGLPLPYWAEEIVLTPFGVVGFGAMVFFFSGGWVPC